MIATEKRHTSTASASTAYKERQVLQLLKDYRAWRTPGGGAMPAEDSHLRSATYGPAGYTRSGQGFPVEGRRLLAETYHALEEAISVVKDYRSDLYTTLTRAYIADTADPSIVSELRQKADREAKRAEELSKAKKPDRARIAEHTRTRDALRAILRSHDEAVGMIARILADRDLYVDFPKPMSIRQAERMEDRNAQVASEYTRFLNSGMKKTQAKEAAGELYGISVRRVEQILEGKLRNL